MDERMVPLAGQVLDWPVFPVERILPGSDNTWSEGVLTIDLDAMARLAAVETGVRTVQAHLLCPGDPVRVTHVAETILPTVDAGNPEATFPGIIGLPAAAPGRQHRLNGVTVLGLVDFATSHDLSQLGEYPDVDSLLDLAGPGAAITPLASQFHLALDFTLEAEVSLLLADRAFRCGCLRVARALAETTLNQKSNLPESLPSADQKLPAVAAVVHVGAEGVLLNTYLYGRSLEGADPTIISVEEFFGGALTNGAYDYAGMRNTTYAYQCGGVVRQLLAGHGSCMDFKGVVIARAYLTSTEEKRRSAQLAAERLVELGAEAVVVTPFQTGNSQSDLMFTLQECERRGIRTAAIVAESDGGLTDEVPEADCLISSGNEDQWIEAWKPERVVGGASMEDGRRALEAGPIMIRHYLGACSQLGDTYIKAVTW
jgi:glycine reductase